MKLYLLTQEENDGYDTYDSLVVAAKTSLRARRIHPHPNGNSGLCVVWASSYKNVTAEYLGEAKEGTEEGVILGSFNAG